MRRGLVAIGIMLIFLIVGLCGCSEQKTEKGQELKINHFTVIPAYIKLGDGECGNKI